EQARILVEPAPTELERVAPLEQRELLRELVGFDVVELLVGGAAERVVADVEGAQARDGLFARDADRRVGIADAGPVEVARLELRLAEAQEQLVGGVRAHG